jgi:uncharacterized protein involved in outer membrane biogenesis
MHSLVFVICMTRTRKILLATAAGVLGLAALAPWLIPTSAWRAPVEQAASDVLGAPVRIGDMSVVILPLPHVTVRNLEVGEAALRLQSVAVYPQMASLLSTPRHLRTVEVSKLDISPAGMALLQKLADQPASGPAPVTIGQVRAKDVAITLATGPLPVLNAHVEMDAGNQPRTIDIATSDDKAKLNLMPDAGGWKLDFAATDWQLPMGPALKFASLKATGRVDQTKLVLPTLTAAMYGGQIKANVELDWQKGIRLAGQAATSRLDIAPFLQALKLKAPLKGRLDASGPFKVQAAKPAGLADAFHADVAFNISDGVLQGFDLASAAKSLLSGGTAGGQTRFDQLNGNLQVAGHALRLRNVTVASGVLDAKANVDVSAAKRLSGRVEVDLKASHGLVGVPLNVSGTVSEPMLMPTKGAMLGAAIGSVLMPGVGTAAGSNLGDRIDKFFSK